MAGPMQRLQNLLQPQRDETYMSPEQIEQARIYARALVAPTNNEGGLHRVEHWTQGVAQMVNALAGRHVLNNANEAANRHATGAAGTTGAPPPGVSAGNPPFMNGPRPPIPPVTPNALNGAPPPQSLATGAINPTAPAPNNLNTFRFTSNGQSEVDPQQLMNLFGPSTVSPNPAPAQGAGGNAVAPTANNRETPPIVPLGNGMSIVTAPGGARVTVNSNIAPRVQAFLNDLVQSGVDIDPSQTGGFNFRNIRGTNVLSNHASGNAVDINWNANPEGQLPGPPRPSPGVDINNLAPESDNPGQTRIPTELGRALAQKHGLVWGGNWRSPDPMHFEAAPNNVAIGDRSITSHAGARPPGRMNLGGPMPEGVADADSGEVILAQSAQNNRRVHEGTGLPYYDPNNLDTQFRPQLPPPIPPNHGFSPEQWAYISRLPTEQRTAIIENARANWTPTYTEMQGGRYWTMPNGQSGFIPTPRYGTLNYPTGPVETVTVFSMDGRRQTYILDPLGEAAGNRAPARPPVNLNQGGQLGTGDILGRIDNPPPQPTAPAPSATVPPPTTELRGTTGAEELGEVGTPAPNPVIPNASVALGFVGSAGSEILNSGMFNNPLYRESVLERRRQDADNAASQAGVAGVINEINEYANALPEGQQLLSTLNMIEGILNTPQARDRMTGALAERWLEFTRTANGILRASGRGPFFDEATVSAEEAIQKLNTYLGSVGARQLTNRPTQFDFQSFLAANPGLGTSDAGSRIMVQILRGMANRTIALAQAASGTRTGAVGTGNISNWENARNQAYDRTTNDIARQILEAARNDVNNRMNIPRGFRYNGREYNGQGSWRDPRNWRPVR
jgi:hypothetical protein